MSLQVRSSTGTAYVPVFQKILEDIQGGVTIHTGELPTTLRILPAGALLAPSSDTAGIYHVVKSAQGQTAATAAAAKTIAVYPNHLFKVGDFICQVSGATASTITAITHTSTTTDTIVCSAKIGTLTTLAKIFQAAAAGAVTTKKYAPYAVLRDNVTIHDAAGVTLQNVAAGAVVRGTVVEDALPYYVTADDKSDIGSLIRFM